MARKELHFFPGTHDMLWVVDGAVVLRAEAWGGEDPAPNTHDSVMRPRRTTPGRYIVYSYGPYRTNTWTWSRIEWGTPLSLDSTGAHVLFETRRHGRRWARVEERIPGMTADAIRISYEQLYGYSGAYDSDGDLIPDIWVFNDFGPYAVRYFRDTNHNRVLDRGESLSGEMIHTTPQNEAQVTRSEQVTLGSSHGCIHMSPLDRDQFRTAGAFDRGTDLIIHDYGETVPTTFT